MKQKIDVADRWTSRLGVTRCAVQFHTHRLSRHCLPDSDAEQNFPSFKATLQTQSSLSKTQHHGNEAVKRRPCGWDGWTLAVMASKVGLGDQKTLSTCRCGEVMADREPDMRGEKLGNGCFGWQRDE